MVATEREMASNASALQRTTAAYNEHIARLTLTGSEYRANQLALQGLNTAQIQHIQSLEAARAAGLKVQVSGSLMQARMLASLPQGDGAILPGCATPAQGALQFASSCPGVTTALCGMSDPAHVRENLAVLALPRAAPAELRALVG